MYPNEPVITVVAPLIDAQLIETRTFLAQVNHQSLIATKTRRIVSAAEGRAASDFVRDCPQYGCWQFTAHKLPTSEVQWERR